MYSWLLCTLLLNSVLSSEPNFNVNDALLYEKKPQASGSRGNYFGFSVALFGGDGDSRKPWVLVGAPRANLSEFSTAREPGTVFRCDLGQACREWFLKRTGERAWAGITGAWIGASVAIDKSRVIVCSPRRPSSFSSGIKNVDGTCRTTQVESTEFTGGSQGHIVDTSESQQIYESVSDSYETGFSLHVVPDAPLRDIVMGGMSTSYLRSIPVLCKDSISTYAKCIVPNVMEEDTLEAFDYSGYAVTSGLYFDSRKRFHVTGAPRGANYHGKVVVYSFPETSGDKITVHLKLVGEQLGEYFGAALTTCDINGDGRDDLIAGAPLWTKNLEEGRVYAFKGKPDMLFDEQHFDAETPAGRFGTAVSCLGDVNHDGFADIAVGAPYEGDSGSIYIFHGEAGGLPKKYSQKISGSQFSKGIRGFGISISEPRDVDLNGHGDVAVGAYLSGHVVLLRAGPVVTINMELFKSNMTELRSNTTTFDVVACLLYTGDRKLRELRVIKTLKVDLVERRAELDGESTKSGIYTFPDLLTLNKRSCTNFPLALKPDTNNLFDPLAISISVSLDNKNTGNNSMSPVFPKLDEANSKTERSVAVPFTCYSDLKLKIGINGSDHYVLGSKSTVLLYVEVENSGDPAYLAQAIIHIPQPARIARFRKFCNNQAVINGTTTMWCDFENPIRNGTKQSLSIELDMKEVTNEYDSMEFTVEVSSKSEEINSIDNIDKTSIHFDHVADIVVAGVREDYWQTIKRNESTRQSESSTFQQIYEVKKFGPSTIDQAVLSVMFPTHWISFNAETELVELIEAKVYTERQEFNCETKSSVNVTPGNQTEFPKIYNLLINDDSSNSVNESEKHVLSSVEKFPSVLSEDRTLYIRCSNKMVRCSQISCLIGPLKKSSSIAQLRLKFNLQAFNLDYSILQGRDIVFYETNGIVKSVLPASVNDKSDNALVATKFFGFPMETPIPLWVPVLSVLLGILLVVLLVLVLRRLGFFHRKEQLLLQHHMSRNDTMQPIILNTNSADEFFDEDLS